VNNPTAIGDLRAACTALASKRSPITELELTSLRRRIEAAVDEMKAAGTSCERVVIAIKAVATDCGLKWNDVDMFERLIGWSVERYYGRH